MNRINQNSAEFEHLLTQKDKLEKILVEYIYGEMEPEKSKRFIVWAKNHPQIYQEIKDLRVTKDLLQTDEKIVPDSIVLPSFYQAKDSIHLWKKRLRPLIQAAAIILILMSSAVLFDVKIVWNQKALTIQFGQDKAEENKLENQVHRLVAEQLPAITYAMQEVVSSELQLALVEREQQYADLLITAVQNQDIVYQEMLKQIAQQFREQRRSDLIQIMQELDDTRSQSNLEIARNRQVLNNLIQYSSSSTPSERVNE